MYIPVSVQIPDFILDLSKEFHKIDPHSNLAGGYLCDLYLGTPFNDVDYFIHADKRRQILSHLETMQIYPKYHGGEYLNVGIDNVYDFKLNGISIQLIFHERTQRPSDFFDFRFRKFYHENGQTYADEEALQDIADKKLSIQCVGNPDSTFTRLIAFQTKYGFLPDTDSTQKLFEFAKNKNKPLKADGLTASTGREIHESLQQHYKNYIPAHSEQVAVISNINPNLLPHELHTKLYEKQGISFSNSYQMKENMHLKLVQACEEKIRKHMLHYRLNFLYEEPDMMNDWQNHHDNTTYFYTIFRSQLNQLKKTPLITPVTELFKQIDSIAAAKFISSIHYTVKTSFISPFKSEMEKLDLKKYANDHYAFVTMDQIGSCIIDVNTGQVIFTHNSYNRLYDFLIPVIQKEIEEQKTLSTCQV
jgi:hypothetical protein